MQCQKSFDTAERQKAFRKIAQDNIASALAKRKSYTDQNRRELEFSVRAWIIVKFNAERFKSNINLPTKWEQKYHGPVELLGKIGPVTYKAELPPTMKQCHNLFHVSKLKKYNKNENSLLLQ